MAASFPHASSGNPVDEGDKMRITNLIPLWLILGALTGCANIPKIYSGEAIHGWVIDAQTKQPIEDVVVLEIWELNGFDSILQMESDHNGNVHIAETLTVKNGYYSFPDWGPKFTMNGRMNESSPHLVFYKFGYDDVHLRNTVSGNLNLDNRISEHSGKKIEMVKFEDSPKEYHNKLGSIYSVLHLSDYRSGFDCMWENIPIFSAKMIKLESFFREHKVWLNIGSGYPRIDSFVDEKCGDPRNLLERYLHE